MQECPLVSRNRFRNSTNKWTEAIGVPGITCIQRHVPLSIRFTTTVGESYICGKNIFSARVYVRQRPLIFRSRFRRSTIKWTQVIGVYGVTCDLPSACLSRKVFVSAGMSSLFPPSTSAGLCYSAARACVWPSSGFTPSTEKEGLGKHQTITLAFSYTSLDQGSTSPMISIPLSGAFRCWYISGS